MIDLRHLKHALALAEYGNFARAADACCITQSALTKSIQSLEDDLGAILFDRNVKPVVPTELGRLVLRHSSVIDTSVRELLRDVAIAQRDDVAELVVGIGLFGGASLVAPVIARLMQSHPKLRVAVKVASWSDLPVKARAREADVIVVEQGVLADQSDFSSLPLSEHRNALVCRSGHPLFSRSTLSLTDLFAYPLVGPALPDAEISRVLAKAPAALRAALTSPEALALRCDSASFLKEILRDSDAIAALHTFMVAREIESGQLAVIPGLDLNITARFCVAWLTGRTISPAAKRFIELLSDYDHTLHARFA